MPSETRPTARTLTDADLDELYLGLRWEGPAHRPAVALGMVASADGAATVAGRSGGLGGDADRRAFRRLREAADVVAVGAGTVRAEGYGPTTVATEEGRRRRVADGRVAEPVLAIVTASADLDPQAPVFSDPDRRPLIITCEGAPADRLEQLTPSRADMLVAGRQRVDLRVAIEQLGEQGHDQVLVEGGPSLNAQLLAEGLVDELFLTVAPKLAGGGPGAALRIVEGSLGGTVELRLRSALVAGDELLLRYAVA